MFKRTMSPRFWGGPRLVALPDWRCLLMTHSGTMGSPGFTHGVRRYIQQILSSYVQYILGSRQSLVLESKPWLPYLCASSRSLTTSMTLSIWAGSRLLGRIDNYEYNRKLWTQSAVLSKSTCGRQIGNGQQSPCSWANRHMTSKIKG